MNPLALSTESCGGSHEHMTLQYVEEFLLFSETTMLKAVKVLDKTSNMAMLELDTQRDAERKLLQFKTPPECADLSALWCPASC